MAKAPKDHYAFTGYVIICALLKAILCISPPEISPMKLPDNLEEGQRLVLVCVVLKGNQPISFSWKKNNLPVLLNDEVRIVHNDEYQESLQIIKLRPDHVGNYTCSAKNLYGSDQMTVPVILNFAPRWLISESVGKPRVVEAEAGRTVMLDCRVQAHPIAVVSILRSKFAYFYTFYWISKK